MELSGWAARESVPTSYWCKNQTSHLLAEDILPGNWEEGTSLNLKKKKNPRTEPFCFLRKKGWVFQYQFYLQA